MKSKEQKVADKIISQMQAAGLTPDDMLRVIGMAKEKFSILHSPVSIK